MPIIRNNAIWGEVKDYLFITFGLLLYTFGWTVFMLPYQIVTGGVTGIAAIVYYASGIPIFYTYLSINAALLFVALKVLGFKFMVKTIYAILMLSVFLGVAQELMTAPDGTLIQVLGDGNVFMSLVIGTAFTGSALAIVFLHNGSTGGTDIVAAIINKYHNISLGTVLIVVDILIIASSLPVFSQKYGFDVGIRIMVTGLCAMMIENFVLDHVMNSRRESVQFLIFSRKYDEIADAIGTRLNHGVTLLDGHGWYTGNELKVLCILAKKRESANIFRMIKLIDPGAFVSQSSVIGVYGEGFDQIKVKLTAKHADQLQQPIAPKTPTEKTEKEETR